MENPLKTAIKLVDGDRQKSYGHPYTDFSKIAKIWSVILGIDVTPKQVALCMVGVKISREVNRPQEDNLVDAAGYIQTAWMVDEEILKRHNDAVHAAESELREKLKNKFNDNWTKDALKQWDAMQEMEMKMEDEDEAKHIPLDIKPTQTEKGVKIDVLPSLTGLREETRLNKP